MSKTTSPPIALLNQPSEIRASDRFERLLACGVPNLQFELVALAVDLDGPEFDADRRVNVRFELLLQKLHHETRLSDVRVADYDEFEKIVVICHY